MTVYSSIAGLYTNFVDGRVYDDLSGQYSYSSWIFNNDMGYMRTTNSIANFSHSSFNNAAAFPGEFNDYNGQPTFGWPSTVIISHSSGAIWIGLPGGTIIGTHSSFENSSFSASNMDLSFSTLSNCNIAIGITDLSFSDITGSTVNGGAIFNGTHVQDAIIIGLPISSKNVTGIPASAPAELINGIFVGTDIDAPGADLSYSQLDSFALNGDYAGANFSYAKLGSTNQNGWLTLSGTFSNANFSRVSFDKVNINIINQNDAINRFSGANFSGADFTGLSAIGQSYGDPSYMSNLVVWLESAGCNLDHAIIPGFPDGYGDVVTYDFATQAGDLYTNLVQVQVDYSALSSDLQSTSNSLATISNEVNVVSDYVMDTEENWDYLLDDLSDTISYMENDVDTLSNEVSYLSNRVYETIQDIQPNIEVINNSNGIITLNMEMRSSGDLQSWRPMYNKEITIVPSNNVQFYRLQAEPGNKGQ